MRFDPPQGGQAELHFERSSAAASRITAQVLIWLALIWVAIGQPTPLADRFSAFVRRTARGSQRRSAPGGTAVDS